MAEKERLKNPDPETPTPLTFSQVSTRYLEYCQGRFQKNTWCQKAFVYRSFLSFIQQDPPAENLPKQIITEYLEHRRKNESNTSANRDLRDIKAMYTWAVRQDILNHNPCKNIDRYPETPKQKYVPPAEDINRVLLAADQEDMELLLILYHTAGRIGEVLRLTWDDVNFEHRYVILKTRKRKGGELQEDKLGMNDTLYDILWRR